MTQLRRRAEAVASENIEPPQDRPVETTEEAEPPKNTVAVTAATDTPTTLSPTITPSTVAPTAAATEAATLLPTPKTTVATTLAPTATVTTTATTPPQTDAETPPPTSLAPTVAAALPPTTLAPTVATTSPPTTLAPTTLPPTVALIVPTTSPTPKPAPTPPPSQHYKPPLPEQESSGIIQDKWHEWNIGGGTDVAVVCGGTFSEKTSCQVSASIQQHQIFYGAFFAAVFLLCFRRCIFYILCCRCCCGPKPDTNRGEYRAVAEQYGGFNDTAFDDEVSAEGEDDYYQDEEDDWSSGPKRGIEMVSQGERNGGLTLEEMNG